MKLLEDRIRQDGEVHEDIVLVDKFLNHQIDVELLEEMAKSIKDHFKDEDISKVITIESSGIAIGTIVAQEFQVPMIFAKKNRSSNLVGQIYQTQVASFTHKNSYPVFIKADLIKTGDKVLLVDDFLAHGNAMYGLIDIVNQAGAQVAGISIAIEKGFLNGGRNLRADGYNVYSLSIIDGFEDGQVIFR